MDITQLILDDHHEQRRLFAMLEQIDRTDTAAPSIASARRPTIGDHNDIRDAVAVAADHEVGSEGGYDAVAGANEAKQRPHGRTRARGPH